MVLRAESLSLQVLDVAITTELASIHMHSGAVKAARANHKPPLAVVVTAGLLSVAGVLVLVELLTELPYLLGLLGDKIGPRYTFLFLCFIASSAAIGVSALYIAMKIYRGDRVAQILAVLLAGAVLLAQIVAYGRSGMDNLVALCSAAALALILFAPAAKDHFQERNEEEPAPVAAARRSVTTLGSISGVVALAYVPLGEFRGKYPLEEGLALAIVALVALGCAERLRDGQAVARYIESAAMVAFIVLVVMFGGARPRELVIPVAFASAAIGLLWFSMESRTHFRS